MSGSLEEGDTVKRFEEVLERIREYPVKHVAVACAGRLTVTGVSPGALANLAQEG